MTYTKAVLKASKQLIIVGMLAAASLITTVQPAMAKVHQITFNLTPNPKFTACLGVQGGPAPEATVTVIRGKLADTLTITGKNFQPKLGFDLFTIQRSQLLANGQPDPNFTNFGQAWYQSDLESDSSGNIKGTIKTILLDQIFGFDPDANLAPTQALHVGFWFNNPNDAAPCGFDVTKPTPFNGEHKAGPNAMVSLPDPTTDLGPLCTVPILENGTFVCDINK